MFCQFVNREHWSLVFIPTYSEAPLTKHIGIHGIIWTMEVKADHELNFVSGKLSIPPGIVKKIAFNGSKWILNTTFVTSTIFSWSLPLSGINYKIQNGRDVKVKTSSINTTNQLFQLLTCTYFRQISEILQTTSLSSIWSFLSNPAFGQLMMFRYSTVQGT